MASFTLSTFLGVAVLSSMALASHGAGIELLQGPCPDGWFYHNCRCFRHVYNKKNWIDAELNCLNLGANLASVHSEDEHQFLQQLHFGHDRVENGPYWIGMSDLYKKYSWHWTDGSPQSDFSKWNPREPNNVGDEHCVDSNDGGSKGWNNILCTRTFASICAKRLND